MNKFIWHVAWGAKPVHMRYEGEAARVFLARVGSLHLRRNGELDRRYKTSRAVMREEELIKYGVTVIGGENLVVGTHGISFDHADSVKVHGVTFRPDGRTVIPPGANIEAIRISMLAQGATEITEEGNIRAAMIEASYP